MQNTIRGMLKDLKCTYDWFKDPVVNININRKLWGNKKKPKKPVEKVTKKKTAVKKTAKKTTKKEVQNAKTK